MEFIDYYQVLGVARTASADEIKKAYRALARRWHPDSYAGDDKDGAERNFQRASEAYEVLSDPEKRRKYDQLGANWKDGSPFAGAAAGPGGRGPRGGGRTMSPEEFEQMFGGRGFSDFFTSVFGDDMASSFGRHPPRDERFGRQGADVRASIQVPISLALRGGERSFEVDARGVCSTCGGSGMLAANHICPACGGVGRRRMRRTVKVKIPREIRDGQVMRLKGLGEPGTGGVGGRHGDLHLVVEVVGDGIYEPRGDDVEGVLPLAPWEAALGAKVAVRTPVGQVMLTVPAGTEAGTRLRVKGHGLARAKAPAAKGAANGGADGAAGRGDFLARVRLVLPRGLEDDQITLLRSLADSNPPRVTGGARVDTDQDG